MAGVAASPLKKTPFKKTPSQRWIHIDINSYFATLLQQENPALRNRAIGVVKDHGRTCVIAASKEAKQLGVKTGSTASEARELAPDILLIPAHFDMSLAATRRLKTIFESTAPHVEIFSLDEAFIDLTDCELLYPDAVALGRQLQERVRKELGEWVTCNVGVSHNRLLAKIASESAPKGSVFVINEENKNAVLASVPFSQVCGVRVRLEKRLRQLGATNAYLINLVSDDILLQEFGPHWAKELRKIGQGEEPVFLEQKGKDQPMKSVGRSITGYKLCDDEDMIRQVLYNLTTEVMYKARRLRRAGRQVSVGLSDKRFRYWGDHRTLRSPIRHTDEMFSILYRELYGRWQRDFPVIKFSVQLSLLEPWESTSEEIWEDWQRDEKVASALDALRNKYGLYAVRSGILSSREELIHPEVTGFLGDKEFQFLS